MPEILTPLVITGELEAHPGDNSQADDLTIIQADRQALTGLVEAILENKRLAWMIVQGWIRAHGYWLVPKG